MKFYKDLDNQQIKLFSKCEIQQSTKSINQKNMKKISQSANWQILLIASLLIILTSPQQQFIDALPIANIQKPTVVESNHYYSSKDRSVNYNVVSLNMNLPVMIIPKNQNKTRMTYSNHVNVTLNDNKGNYISCMYEDNFELCVLEKFDSDTLSMIIQCDTVPCEFSWIMVQSPIEKINTSTVQKISLKQLYEIQQSQQNRHLTLKVTCDSPQFQHNFHNELEFYANKQNYHRLKTQGITYYLFNNPPTSFKQYFFIKINEKYRTCAKIEIENQQTSVSINSEVHDFVLAASSVVYNLPSSTKDFQLDSNIHLFSQNDDFSGNFTVKLMGSVGGIQQTIRQMSLLTKKKKNIEFSFVLNNISSTYSDIQLMFDSSKLDCIIKFQLLAGEIQKVQKGEFSFFSLKKGEKVTYQIIEDAAAQKGDKTYVFPSEEKKMKLSKQECESREGCQFQLQVLEDLDGSIYIGQSKTKNTEEVVKFSIDKSFTKRVPEGTIVYLQKKIQQNKNYQVVVNTHNVLLYAANEQKCPQPHDKCHQKVGNSHNPFIYESEKNGTLIIAVHALDSSQFTVTIIQEDGEYPQIKDGVPFTYLMDQNEEDVVFKFNLDQKEDVTFSIVAPLNQLELYVFQSAKLPKNYVEKTQLFTSDGSITLKKSQITSKEFIVVVRKLDTGNAKFVHFTLIASTKNANIKLEVGVTHIEKLAKNQHQQFVLEFDPKQAYVVSFYVHDSIGQKINISLELSKNDTYTKDNQHFYEIDHEVDEIDISKEGEKVCESKGTKSCEVFLRLTNKMDRNVNLQLTLLSTNSIVELHDGLWQYFPQELTSTTTHFYFFPKHQNNPVSILYQSNNPDLRIFYSLAKMDVETINPQSWSFPSVNNQKTNQFLNLNQRQVKSISIGKQALAACSPNCLVMMTLAKSDKVKGQFDEIERDKQFGIMVSNNIIDIPEKTRVDITLQKGETKYLKMNLANVFQHDTLTSYIYTSLGFVSVYANACSQKNIRMPTNEQFDFSFGILETQLRTQTLKKKFEANDIDENANPFLCLIAISDENSKFSIQYTSEEEIVSLLRLDEYKTVELKKGEPKYFQIQASVEHTVKIVRNKGYPYIEEKKCTGKDTTYEQCLQEFQDNKQKPLSAQMIEKVKRYQYTPCQKCIVYLKLYSDDLSEVDIHLESKYTEITLEEKKIVTDYLEKNEENRYEVTALSNEPSFITLNVINGDIKCKVTDLNGINIEKTSSQKQRVLHFSITSKQLAQTKKSLSSIPQSTDFFSSLFSGFGLQNIFTTLHISVQSTDPQKAASYTIQYSSGERESYLQDGMVAHYKLQANSPKTPVKFYYENYDQNSHAFVFLGATSSWVLSRLEINIYSMDDENNEDSKQQINSNIPEMRKKTAKPTVLYPLPIAKFYQIQVFNPTGQQIELSIGVNHQQIVFLPYDIDYPFPMANSYQMNFIVDLQSKGYVLLTLKKCDESSVEFSYTLDYEGFQKGDYQYTTTLQNDPKMEQLVKVKQPGPLYVNVKRNQLQGISQDVQFKESIFSLNARFSFEKIKTNDFTKPGNRGMISYELLNDNKIRIQFAEVTCDAKNNFCGANFEYFLVASDKMVDVYSQSVCPTTYFADVQTAQKHSVLPLRKILQKPDSNHKITFEYQFQKSNSISYIAIKAVFKNKQNDSIEVYYQPIEVVTIWGQLQKASNKFGKKLGIGFGVIISFCLFLICLRRKKRKGYESINEND